MKLFFRDSSSLLLAFSVVIVVLICWPFAAYLVYCVDQDLFYALPFFSLLGLAVGIHGLPFLLNFFVIRWLVGGSGFRAGDLRIDLVFLSTLFTSLMLYLTVLLFLVEVSAYSIFGLIVLCEIVGFVIIGRNRVLWMEN